MSDAVEMNMLPSGPRAMPVADVGAEHVRFVTAPPTKKVLMQFVAESMTYTVPLELTATPTGATKMGEPATYGSDTEPPGVIFSTQPFCLSATNRFPKLSTARP
jgi:hypothetical protein